MIAFVATLVLFGCFTFVIINIIKSLRESPGSLAKLRKKLADQIDANALLEIENRRLKRQLKYAEDQLVVFSFAIPTDIKEPNGTQE